MSPFPIRETHTLQALIWRYGPSAAAAKRDGKDEAFNADLAAWKRLCALADIQQQRSGGKA